MVQRTREKTWKLDQSCTSGRVFVESEGDIWFKTRIRGKFKIDEENTTVAAIQELIKNLDKGKQMECSV